MILHHSSHLTINLSGPRPLSFLLHTDDSFLSNKQGPDISPSFHLVLSTLRVACMSYSFFSALFRFLMK